MNSAENIVLAANALNRSFVEGGRTLQVLKEIEFSVRRGERVAVIGASGSGKTTLLQIIGGLDAPTSGAVYVDGVDINTLSDAQRGKLRNRSLGFVYQFHHLLPEFSALENVAMPLLIRGEAPAYAREAALELLTQVGLADRIRHRPAQLSGGERQRTAIARALVARPAVVLADEPTGNLDRRTGEKVFDLLLDCNERLGTSLVVVTHDADIAARMDRILELEDGQLTETQGAAA